MPTEPPVCHISPENQFNQPPAARVPNIPAPDGSMEGMLATINALKTAVEALAGFRTPDQNRKGFSEVRAKRQVDRVKVFNPEDKEQFVEVERIKHIEWIDKATGQRIVWDR